MRVRRALECGLFLPFLSTALHLALDRRGGASLKTKQLSEGAISLPCLVRAIENEAVSMRTCNPHPFLFLSSSTLHVSSSCRHVCACFVDGALRYSSALLKTRLELPEKKKSEREKTSKDRSVRTLHYRSVFASLSVPSSPLFLLPTHAR